MKKLSFWLIAALAVCVALSMTITSCILEEEQEEVTQLKGTLTITGLDGGTKTSVYGVEQWEISSGTTVTANYAPKEGETVTYEWRKVESIVPAPISIDPEAPVPGGAGGFGINVYPDIVGTAKTFTVTGTSRYTVQVRPTDTVKYGTGPLGIKCVIKGK